MEPTERKDDSARILLRMSGIAVALIGAVGLIPLYGVTINRLTEPIDPTRGVVVCVTIFVLGIAVACLRRWAVVLLSIVGLAFSLFVSWGCLRSISFPWSIFVAAFYVAIFSLPAACTYFAWRELR